MGAPRATALSHRRGVGMDVDKALLMGPAPTRNSLKAAAKAGLPVADWAEAEKTDRMARRASGLDSEEGSRLQIGLAPIETRLQAINLPKDTVET